MNIIIDDTDHPLIIKVASIQAARMQVYFIDNDDYFQRKFLFSDDKELDFLKIMMNGPYSLPGVFLKR